METIDWACQGVSGAVTVWLLYEWWKDDKRIAKVAPKIAIAFCIITALGVCFWVGRTTAVQEQWSNDTDAVRAELSKRSDALLDVVTRIIKPDVISSDRDIIRSFAATHAELLRVDSAIVTSRSVLMLFGLYLVSLFVWVVPAPTPTGSGTDEKPKNE